MTHGCLEIRRHGERSRVFLHTYHTGMDIPVAVEGAFRVLAAYNSWILRHAKTSEEILRNLRSSLAHERLRYPMSAAALIIAAYPGLLEPCPPAFVKDLPKWGGQDNPYRLVVSNDRWLLSDESGNEILDCDPTERFVQELLALASKS